MDVRMSAASPEGHLIVMRLPPGTQVVLVAPGVEAEAPSPLAQPGEVVLTEWACDLALIGLAQHAALIQGETAEAGETVELGGVELRDGQGQPLDPLSAGGGGLYLHPPTQTAHEFDLRELLGMVARGVQAQLVAGVASDIAETEMPSSPEGLPPGPG